MKIRSGPKFRPWWTAWCRAIAHDGSRPACASRFASGQLSTNTIAEPISSPCGRRRAPTATAARPGRGLQTAARPRVSGSPCPGRSRSRRAYGRETLPTHRADAGRCVRRRHPLFMCGDDTRPRHRRRRLRRREPRASRSPSATPTGSVVALRQPQAPRLGAQPRRGCARPGVRVRARRRARAATTCCALGDVDAIVECSAEPSRARRRRRRARLPRADEPARRLPLPRARAPRRRAVRLPLDQPRLSRRRRSSALALRGGARRASSSRDEQPVPGASRGRRSPRTSRSTARARSTARPSSPPSC